MPPKYPDSGATCPFCQAYSWQPWATYEAPPAGETCFPSIVGQTYRRTIQRCGCCGHFISTHLMEIRELYDGEYVNATYHNEEGLQKTFRRIMSLPPELSDNRGRVDWVNSFSQKHLPANLPRTLLDIGSGLSVFPYLMATEHGWQASALDPDSLACQHARELGLTTIQADFLHQRVEGTFSLVSLNKVLEHVPDPLAMLAKAATNLTPGGLCYIELPDGETASQEGTEREEFFIEHLHIFSMASMCLLIAQSGLEVLQVSRLREPSTKFTLRAFARHPALVSLA